MQSGVKGFGSGWTIQEIVLKDGVTTHYANGTLLQTLYLQHNTMPGGEIRLGAEHAGSMFVDMDIAEIVVYNRALSAGERIAMIQYFQSRYFRDERIANPFGDGAAEVRNILQDGSINEVPEEIRNPGTVPAQPQAEASTDAPSESDLCIAGVSLHGKPCVCDQSCYACELVPGESTLGKCLQCMDSQFLSLGFCVPQCASAEMPSGDGVFGRTCIAQIVAGSGKINAEEIGQAGSGSSSSSSLSTVAVVGKSFASRRLFLAFVLHRTYFCSALLTATHPFLSVMQELPSASWRL